MASKFISKFHWVDTERRTYNIGFAARLAGHWSNWAFYRYQLHLGWTNIAELLFVNLYFYIFNQQRFRAGRAMNSSPAASPARCALFSEALQKLKRMNKRNKILFLLIGCSVYGYSQTGKITGKLNLQDIENKNAVITNTFAILKSKTICDSVKIDENLSFKFESLPSDTFTISFSQPSYPYSGRYIVNLNDGEIENLNVPYSSTCPYEKTKDGICPVCKKKDEVIPIRYGLLAVKIEKNKKPSKRKYKPGGCIVMDCQPSWFCERDQKDF